MAIHEINALRKHLLSIKSGLPARRAAPATVCTLICSNLAGNSLNGIASGRTVLDDVDQSLLDTDQQTVAEFSPQELYDCLCDLAEIPDSNRGTLSSV